MILGIPKDKSSIFANELFNTLSNILVELREATGKWPDQILFSGHLGKELHNYIIKNDWNLSQFSPKSQDGADKIFIQYSKPLLQIEEGSRTLFDKPLNDRIINHIPDANTFNKIVGAYASTSFTIERTIKPKIEIKLKRI